jgi:hypothetical protein
LLGKGVPAKMTGPYLTAPAKFDMYRPGQAGDHKKYSLRQWSYRKHD